MTPVEGTALYISVKRGLLHFTVEKLLTKIQAKKIYNAFTLRLCLYCNLMVGLQLMWTYLS